MVAFPSARTRKHMVQPLLFALLLVIASAASLEAAELVGRASVIDADTIEIHNERIRLHGIDAPESSQTCRRTSGEVWRCGQAAALALADRIGSKPVRCDARERDRYGRVIGVCHDAGGNLNSWLVQEGWAVAYRQYSDDYTKAEGQAREAEAGIWSGDFVQPWDWRRGKRLAKSATPTECKIKGNIGSKGDRIYHVPGGQFYGRTKIDTRKGERWFCTEAEAKAAGWRRSKR